MKKDSGLFGVGMGAFDGTEVWELLHKLSENYERINHAISNNVRGTVSKKKKKNFCKLLTGHDLDNWM